MTKLTQVRFLRIRNRYLFLIDFFAIPLAAYSTFVLRLDRFALGSYGKTALVYALLSLLVKIPVFFTLGGYSRYWPFASISEVWLILETVFAGSALTALLAYLGSPLIGVRSPPRSIPFLDFFLSGLAFSGPRLAIRVLYHWKLREGGGGPAERKRILIVGAGEGGNLVMQEIRRNPQLGLQPVGLVDDDPAKHNLEIRGVRVLGPVDEIPKFVETYSVDQVLIAIPTATADEMRQIVDACRQAEVDVRTLPGMFEVLAGDVSIERFRPVQVEDLLARSPVHTDTTKVERLIRGTRVLVTGAGGSIGSELCRQIAWCDPQQLVLLGHGETSIFHVKNELQRDFSELEVIPCIADIRDAVRVQRLFAEFGPDIVFHAAAHKHVPLMEANPEEAITNNVGGTQSLLRAAELTDVSHFVMISTDKAVNPTSIMGASKRVAEHLVQEAAYRTGRHFVAVRFGNVLGSRGSVVPVFEQQIRDGGPVTVTHPEIKRYFMTIPEAVQLVLQAAGLGHGGEVFVLDMGEPVKIVDLARDMIRLAGFEADKGIEIIYTGLRPGEKLFEELFLDDESYSRTTHEKIFVSQNGKVPTLSVQDRISQLVAAAKVGDTARMMALVRKIVPEGSLSVDVAATKVED